MFESRKALRRSVCLPTTGIVGSESSNGGPIEIFATLIQEPLKSVVQQAAERHWHVQIRCRGQHQTDVLESERRGEACRLISALGDKLAVGRVRGCRED